MIFPVDFLKLAATKRLILSRPNEGKLERPLGDRRV